MATPRKRNVTRSPQYPVDFSTLEEVVEETALEPEPEPDLDLKPEPEPTLTIVPEPKPTAVFEPPVPVKPAPPILSMVPVDMPQTKPVLEEKVLSKPVAKREIRRRNIPRFTR
jgi:hypothetical protein